MVSREIFGHACSMCIFTCAFDSEVFAPVWPLFARDSGGEGGACVFAAPHALCRCCCRTSHTPAGVDVCRLEPLQPGFRAAGHNAQIGLIWCEILRVTPGLHSVEHLQLCLPMLKTTCTSICSVTSFDSEVSSVQLSSVETSYIEFSGLIRPLEMYQHILNRPNTAMGLMKLSKQAQKTGWSPFIKAEATRLPHHRYHDKRSAVQMNYHVSCRGKEQFRCNWVSPQVYPQCPRTIQEPCGLRVSNNHPPNRCLLHSHVQFLPVF